MEWSCCGTLGAPGRQTLDPERVTLGAGEELLHHRTWITADRGDTAMYALKMGERLSLVESNRTEIQEIVRRHRGRSVALFGSVARGDDTAASDIDFLVEFLPGSSLFDLLHISEELEALLGMSVDVVSVGGLKARDDHIRREAMPL